MKKIVSKVEMLHCNISTQRKKAFTLVELIIVITILAILATVAFVSFSNYAKESRDAQRLSSLTNIEKGIDIYGIEVGRFPIPENSTSFTGGTNSEIKQGILTKNVLQNLSSTPVDPVSGKNYTYSVFGNGKYYQIATSLENELSHNFGKQAYANQFKTTKLVGNYRYDPSLPSLIIGSGTNIFSPDTCFITNGGTDTLENCITKKSDFAGNNTDSSLVGYWDMETRTNDNLKLKDLSGNGNDGFFTGGLNYSNSLSGGLIGKGLALNPGSLSGQAIEIPYNEILKPKYITMSAIFRGDGRFQQYPYIITNGDPSTNGSGLNGVFMNMSTGEFLGAYLYNSTTSGVVQIQNQKLSENQYYYGVVVYDGEYFKLYINGGIIAKMQSKGEIFWDSEYKGILIGRARYDIPQLNGTFQGIIDEVKIYNRALTDEEILQQARIAGF